MISSGNLKFEEKCASLTLQQNGYTPITGNNLIIDGGDSAK